MKKTDSAPSRNGILWLALLISLGFNLQKSSAPKENPQQVLASAGSQNFKRSDLSPLAQKNLASLDGTSYLILKKEVEAWTEKIVLPKEAQARGKTEQQLLDQEVTQKVQVSPEEVTHRLTLSPTADAFPYPQVLKDIENDLKGARAQSEKTKFLESLYPKYQVRVKLRPPQGLPPARTAFPTKFPAYEPPPDGAPSRGPADAPVTIEIYSDFMCPFSARFFNTMKEVEKQYADKVRVIYHQFPLPFHQGSHLMSEASLCADEQGKFWEFHDRLMGEQKGKKEKAELAQIAQELGLDTAKFGACVDSGKYVARVDQDITQGKSIGVSGTPGYMINGRLGTGAVPFEALKPSVEWCLKPQGPYPGRAKPTAPGGGAPSQGLDPNKVYPLSPDWLKKSPSQGPDKAPVTIVEFMDFNCPFCQKGSVIIDGIMAAHKNDVRLISKEFPLPMHPNAMNAALATSCAALQGKFWEYRKELFGPSWGKQSVEDLKAAAKKVGLKESDFNACLDQAKPKDLVNEDIKTASALGVQGTPTFFINGSPLVGAQPAEKFEQAIEAKKKAAGA